MPTLLQHWKQMYCGRGEELAVLKYDGCEETGLSVRYHEEGDVKIFAATQTHIEMKTTTAHRTLAKYIASPNVLSPSDDQSTSADSPLPMAILFQ